MSAVPIPRVGHFIDGALSAPNAASRRLPVTDPSSGQVIAEVECAEVDTVNAAISAARRAWPSWADTPAARRARVLFAFRERLVAGRMELAQIIGREHGKGISDAEAEVARGLEIVEFACGAPRLLSGVYSDQVGVGLDNFSLRQPLGVVAGITPYNFPVMVPLWMAPLAMVAGNCFVLKPSELDPSASLKLAQWFSEAGVPAGVFSVLQGNAATAEALISHSDIAAVSFVGSTAIAKQVQQRAVATGKRVQALGGAKNHLVVMPDANLDLAAQALVGAAFGSAGQRCMAVAVAVAVGGVGDALIQKILQGAAKLILGAAATDADVPPLISAAHRERVKAHVAAAEAEGALLRLDGREHPLVSGAGFYLGPCLLDQVQPSMRAYREEIFGPVLCVLRAPDLESALSLINSHPLANGAICYTASGAVGREFALRAAAGMIGINVPIPVPAAWQSFGGWRQSLLGDHHAYGEEALRFYTRYKSVMQRWPGDTSLSGDKGLVMPVN